MEVPGEAPGVQSNHLCQTKLGAYVAALAVASKTNCKQTTNQRTRCFMTRPVYEVGKENPGQILDRITVASTPQPNELPALPDQPSGTTHPKRLQPKPQAKAEPRYGCRELEPLPLDADIPLRAVRGDPPSAMPGDVPDRPVMKPQAGSLHRCPIFSGTSPSIQMPTRLRQGANRNAFCNCSNTFRLEHEAE